ncbi:unnamed protein product, partial [Lymnaea stagnalis]
ICNHVVVVTFFLMTMMFNLLSNYIPQSLQSSLHPQGGLGVVSLSVIYGTTVLSCLMAPWLINRMTTKWTMVLAFSLFTAYFAANFYPRHFIIIPLSVILGGLAGPMWSAQATYVTTLALTYAQHRRIIFESDDVINQFMGVFFGFYRCSQIWGNIISTLILTRNETDSSSNATFDLSMDWEGSPPCNSTSPGGFLAYAAMNDRSTRYMLLTTYLACGVMAAVVVMSLLDQIHVGKTEADPEFSQSSWELCLSTVKMLKDTKCLLLMPMVVFVGLEQGFMFGDFTKVSTRNK